MNLFPSPLVRRSLGMNLLYFPAESARQILPPLSGLNCASYNTGGSNSRYNTPADMIYPFHHLVTDAFPDVTQDCARGNQGNLYAISAPNSNDEPRMAVEKSMLQGALALNAEVVNPAALNPLLLNSAEVRRTSRTHAGTFLYDFRPDKDRVQWVNDQVMKREKERRYGSGCQRFTRDQLSYAREGEFSLASRQSNWSSNDPQWQVAYLWKKFVGCQYRRRICSGGCPEPIYQYCTNC